MLKKADNLRGRPQKNPATSMGLRMEAADEIRSSERELMTGSGACRAKVHACRALAFRTRMTFMRRRGPGEPPYNSRQSAPSCLAGRLMSDLGQRLSPAFQPALPYRRVDARVKRFLDRQSTRLNSSH